MTGKQKLPRCGSCRWYERQPMQIKQGACFRYPPQATNHVNNIGQTISLCCHPTVMDDNGACGEHEYALDYTDAEVAGKEE